MTNRHGDERSYSPLNTANVHDDQMSNQFSSRSRNGLMDLQLLDASLLTQIASSRLAQNLGSLQQVQRADFPNTYAFRTVGPKPVGQRSHSSSTSPHQRQFRSPRRNKPASESARGSTSAKTLAQAPRAAMGPQSHPDTAPQNLLFRLASQARGEREDNNGSTNTLSSAARLPG